MTGWSLQVGSRIGSLADWTIDAIRMRRASLSAGTLTFRVHVRHVATSPVARHELVTLRYDDTVRFHGLITYISASIDPAQEYYDVVVSDPWHWLRLIFQQTWVSGDSTNVFLFFGKNTAQQIQEIIAFAVARGAPMQLALPVVPAIDIPICQERDLKCENAIRQCLQCSPDVATWFDYSTLDESGNPKPTLHFVRRTDMESVRVAIDGESFISSTIEPREDWTCTAVQLNYEQTITDGDVKRHSLTTECAPIEAWDPILRTLKAEYALDALVQTIDLEGEQRSYVTATIQTIPIDPTNLDWWKEHAPGLAGTNLENLTVNFVGVWQQEAGEQAVPLQAWPGFELVKGNIAPWMEAAEVKCLVVVGDATYNIVDQQVPPSDPNFIVEQISMHRISIKIKVATDLDTGGVPKVFSALSQVSAGETVPVGLATYVYEALRDAHYEGAITLTHRELPGTWHPGMRLNIDNAEVGWATMNAVIQEVEEDLVTGTTVLRLGVPPHLTALDLMGMVRWNRHRRIWMNPLIKTDPTIGAGGAVELGQHVPGTFQSDVNKVRTSIRLGCTLRLGDTTNYILIDGCTGNIVIVRNGETAIALNGPAASVFIQGNGASISLATSEAGGHAIHLQQTDMCEGNSPVTKLVLRE